MILADILGNRKYLRAKSEIDVLFLNFRGRTIDLNIEACKVAICKELSVDDNFNVILKLPERDVRVDCTCLRSNAKSEICEAVLKFINPSPSFISCIEEHVRSVLENWEYDIRRRAFREAGV